MRRELRHVLGAWDKVSKRTLHAIFLRLKGAEQSQPRKVKAQWPQIVQTSICIRWTLASHL